MKRSRGQMSTHTKKLKGKGRATPMEFIKEFALGSHVLIFPRSYQKGLPPLRYSYRHGVVVKKQGHSYVIELEDGRKKKKVICHPVHLIASKNW